MQNMSVASELLNSRHVSDVDWHCNGMHVRLTTTSTIAKFGLGLPAMRDPVRRIEDNVSHIYSLFTTRLADHERSTARLIIFGLYTDVIDGILDCDTTVINHGRARISSETRRGEGTRARL